MALWYVHTTNVNLDYSYHYRYLVRAITVSEAGQITLEHLTNIYSRKTEFSVHIKPMRTEYHDFDGDHYSFYGRMLSRSPQGGVEVSNLVEVTLSSASRVSPKSRYL